jgi:type IV pilus assembly protein PilA
MLQRLRQRAGGEKGFTLIELLVVILIIGILAAIAIPSFLNQKGKANDANAKAVARAAQTAEETYFTDNQTYAPAASQLEAIETTLSAADPGPANGPHGLVVNSANTTSYSVSVTSGASTPVTYTIANSGGTVTRSCTPASTGGCNATSVW